VSSTLTRGMRKAMTQTVYTITRQDGKTFETHNAVIAQHESERGRKVTARTNQWV